MQEQQINQRSATRNTERNHYVFQCITLNPEQRPNGKRITEGCGRWCVYSSPKELRYLNNNGEQEILQGYCSNHPENKTGNRKQRLNEERLDIRTLTTRKDAQYIIDTLNGVREQQQPKDEPQGLTLRDIQVPAPLGESNPTGWTAEKWKTVLRRREEHATKKVIQQAGEEEAYWDDLASKGLI